jgi:hypothetical protein
MTLLLSGRYFCTFLCCSRARASTEIFHYTPREANDNLAAAHDQWREYSFCVYAVNYDLGARGLAEETRNLHGVGRILRFRREALAEYTALKITLRLFVYIPYFSYK